MSQLDHEIDIATRALNGARILQRPDDVARYLARLDKLNAERAALINLEAEILSRFERDFYPKPAPASPLVAMNCDEYLSGDYIVDDWNNSKRKNL